MKTRFRLPLRRSSRFTRAFTLIEMLVVVLILAILAALIVPRVINRTSDAKRAKAASDIATLSSLLQQYRIDNDAFPSTEQGLSALRVQPSDATNWHGPYTSKELPTDPWGNEYSYESPGANGEDYVITSYGADGAPGGEGDAADLDSAN
jgi:general secretion pathway protein G